MEKDTCLNNMNINCAVCKLRTSAEIYFSGIWHCNAAVNTVAVRNGSGICGPDADLSSFTDICVALREYNQNQIHCEDYNNKAGITNICLEYFLKV